MKTTESEFVEMYVKFWEPYAVRMAAKDVDVIERVPAWLPKIFKNVKAWIDEQQEQKSGQPPDTGWETEHSATEDDVPE